MDEMKPLGVWLKKLLTRERRGAKRKSSVPLVAHYWDGGSPVAHVVRDISTTGLYLLTDQRWYPGTTIEMTLQKKGVQDDRKDRTLKIKAKVIWVGTDGVGLVFMLKPSHGSVAANLVDMNTLKSFLRGLKDTEGQAGGERRTARSSDETVGREEAVQMRTSRGERGQGGDPCCSLPYTPSGFCSIGD